MSQTAATYRSSVEHLMTTGSSSLVSNGQLEHARILLETFLKFAESKVVFFCRNLSKGVFDCPLFIDRVDNALMRGIQLDIICQVQPESLIFVKAVNLWREKNLPIELTVASETNSKRKELVVSRKANFCVMDRRAYRFEPDSGDHKAVACMNDEKLSLNLAEAFYHLKSALLLPLPSVAL
jgi:hypothetical protein